MSCEYFESLPSQFESILTTVDILKTQLGMLQSQIKKIEKQTKKEETLFKKKISKTIDMKSHHGVARKPSGFATPSRVSTELCVFLNKTDGTEIARTEVTKSVVAYIKENCSPASNINKSVITPDDKLRSLLGISDEQKLTYFSLQKYMNKHFIKPSTNANIGAVSGQS